MEMILGITIGAFLTLLGSYWLFVLQRKRKRLGYEVLSANLVIPFESKPGDSLRVVVKREVVADDAELIEQEFITVGKVYGFRVMLRNTGNETIQNQAVLIQLDDNAKIVATEVEHAPVGMTGIVTERDQVKPYVAKCYFPFMNEGDDFIVSIQSVRNESTECNVSAPAPGLQVHDLAVKHRRRDKLAMSSTLAGTGLMWAAIITGVAVYGWDSRLSDILTDTPRGQLILFAMGLGFLASMIGMITMLLVSLLRD